jgi:acyl-[acyl-carrier-protein]-phospholipid O-acyltransferase/long-chain-fatty-acid--[acyl-carrier-protein] ligase
LIEGATFVAIICGLVFGGLAAAQGRSPASVTAQLMLIAFGCYAAARAIPPTGIGAPGLTVHKNVFASTFAVIREIRADSRQWVGALGVSWFWAVGAVTLSLLPVIIKPSEIMHSSSVVVLEAIPLLGSGKTNYVALVKSLRERGA